MSSYEFKYVIQSFLTISLHVKSDIGFGFRASKYIKYHGLNFGSSYIFFCVPVLSYKIKILILKINKLLNK